MANSQIIRLSATPNATVVQLPERKNPGVVIQGDSLTSFALLLDEALHELDEGNASEAHQVIAELREIVQDYLESYNQATSPANQH